MNDREVFEKMFELAKKSHDPKGVVSSVLVVNGEVVAEAKSSDDGSAHAENILLENVDTVPVDAVLYSTLEPCSKRTNPTMVDCVTAIINAGVQKIVFAARDPKQSEETNQRLKEAGVIIQQVDDAEIIRQASELFNKSVTTEGVDLKPLD